MHTSIGHHNHSNGLQLIMPCQSPIRGLHRRCTSFLLNTHCLSHHHQCISSTHHGSIFKAQIITPIWILDSPHPLFYLFRCCSSLPFWWASLRCCHYCQARKNHYCTWEFTLCVALILMNSCSPPFYLDVIYCYPPFWGLHRDVVVHCQARMSNGLLLYIGIYIICCINATNILYVRSSAEQIAVLYTAAVWDRKTCGQAVSTSHLDDANLKWKTIFYPIVEKVG